MPAVIEDSLQIILEDFIEENDIPGGVLAVQSRGGEWTWEGQNGEANINTMQSANTSFHYRIGSISKQFLAVTIMHLVENDVLSLTDTIGKWLNPLLMNEIPYSEQITIKHLLNHTSGIFSYTEDTQFLTALLTDPNATFTPDSLINIGVSHPPQFVPGNDWSYNNTGYVMLAKIIEEASGISYHQYATDSILAPAELDSTYYPTSNIITTDHMRCYADYTGDQVLEDYTDVTETWAYGSGEIVSTLDDQLLYYNKLLDGQIISPTSYAELRTPFYPDPNYTYGLGTYIINNNLIGHSGLYFSTTGLWHFEDLDVLIAYQFNLYDVPVFDLLGKIKTLLMSNNVSVFEVKANTDKIVSVYPNPATENLTVEFANFSGDEQIYLYNITGKEVKKWIPQSKIETFDIKGLAPGIYTVVIQSNDKTLEKQKVVISNR
ncbi:MAG: serine hydrolase [Brumimicrobium sp.]